MHNTFVTGRKFKIQIRFIHYVLFWLCLTGFNLFLSPGTAQTACFTLSINPTSLSFPSSGGDGNIRVSSSVCVWSATTNDSWINIIVGGGVNNGNVIYSVGKFKGTGSRSGTIKIAGKNHTVVQMGTQCEYEISPSDKSFDADGGAGKITIAVSNGCLWNASEDASWITITSGSSGSGKGTINYSVSSHTGTGSRSADITVGGETHTITQKVEEVS